MATEAHTSSKIDEIPEDLIIQVLLWLPVKSLLQSKTVCKTWYSLINNPNFTTMHHNFPTNSQLLLTNYAIVEGKRTRVLSFRSNDKSSSILAPDLEIPISCDHFAFIIGSCNGIVCLYDWFSLFLCNPATKKFKQLPPSSFPSGKQFKSLGLPATKKFKQLPPSSFPSGKQFKSLGLPAFGVDSSDIYNFKVIDIYWEVDREGCEGIVLRAEVYSLASNTWRQLDWVCEDRTLIGENESNYCGNSCHWHMQRSDPLIESILCFDMHTESFKSMNFPKHFRATRERNVCLKIVKECLSVFNYSPIVEGQCIDIWIMKEHGVEDSWTNFCRIGPLPLLLSPLSFWMDDHALLFRHADKKLISFNINNQDIESLEFFWDDKFVNVVVYKETLLPIE